MSVCLSVLCTCLVQGHTLRNRGKEENNFIPSLNNIQVFKRQTKTENQIIFFRTMLRTNTPAWVPIFSCIFLAGAGLVICTCLVLSLIPLYLSNSAAQKSTTTASGLKYSSF